MRSRKESAKGGGKENSIYTHTHIYIYSDRQKVKKKERRRRRRREENISEQQEKPNCGWQAQRKPEEENQKEKN